MIPRFVKVAIPQTTVSTVFDYAVPADCKIALQVGLRVAVPFRQQTKIGIIIEVLDRTDVPAHKIKAFFYCLDPSPLCEASLWALANWLADYYFVGIGDILQLIFGLQLQEKNFSKDQQIRLSWRYSPNPNLEKKLSLAQKRSLLHFKKERVLDLQQCQAYRIHSSTLNSLLKRQLLIEEEKIAADLSEKALLTGDFLEESPPVLNSEQAAAVSEIAASFSRYQVWVLDGVTGSGKTEVYLQLIAQCLARQGQVLVLIPEIGLTPQTLQRFQARFNVPMVLIHSALTTQARFQAWRLAQSTEAKIVIGTRSAVFIPMPALQLIIIDEAHDQSFKQQEQLRYHAKDVAIKRAQLCQIPVVLGSATHSVEVYHHITQKKFRVLALKQRAGTAVLPRYELVDIRHEQIQESGLSPYLLEKLKATFARGEQALLFLNRRGFSPTLLCQNCAWIALCTQCDSRMTYHQQPLHLRCHHCNTRKALPVQCPSCQSRYLSPLGYGTAKIETALKHLLPMAKILRIDRDSMQNKTYLATQLQAVLDQKVNLLIGTQMLAKGHHFPNVTTVVILDGDSGFFSAELRASEHFAQLLLQVAGRAGRAEKPGVVYIQTRYPMQVELQTLVTAGYAAFVTQLLQTRQLAAMPPFTAISLFQARFRRMEDSQACLLEIKKILMAKLEQEKYLLLGPVSANLAKKKGYHIAQLLVQADSKQQLQRILSLAMPKIQSQKFKGQGDWVLDRDPLILA